MRLPAVVVLAVTVLTACNPGNVREFQNADATHHLTDAESRRWYAADQLDESMRNQGLVFRDDALQAYLQEVMDRLYPEFEGSLRVHAADSPLLNAFALPNGSIYLNIGLLARMRNEAQLAAVLGHEATHFVEQHSLKQRETLDSAAIAGVTVTLLTGIPFSGDLLAAGLLSGYSQDFEREADRQGFARMSTAGYDTTEAAEVFRIMLEEVEALDIDQPFLYSSHPRLQERIETLDSLAASDQGSTAGDKGSERFSQHIDKLREIVLQRYLSQQDYKRLILILEDEHRRSLYPAHARFYLGEAYRLRDQEEDRAKAVHAYLKTLHEAADFPATYRSLGLMYMKKGETQSAIGYFEQYLALDPDSDQAAYARSFLKRLKD